MKEMLNNNMKFNIVFTVGDPNGMQSLGFPADYDEEEFDFAEYEDDEDDEDDYDEDDEDEEEEDEKKETDAEKKKRIGQRREN